MNNYSQSANPNATNSELDSKKIVTNRPLTSAQRDELIEQYVQLQVDSMDMECLLTIATDFVTDYCEKLSDSELKQEIDNHDDELFDELVDNVTNEDEDAKLQHLEEIKYDREVN